jgi:hypothetical protein
MFARGLLPGGVMLTHSDSAAYGLTVALCSGGQLKLKSIGDAADPQLSAGGQCVYAAAALPMLPPSLPAATITRGPFAAPLALAFADAPHATARVLPPARGPPQLS